MSKRTIPTLIPCPHGWQGCQFKATDNHQLAAHLVDVHQPVNRTVAQIEMLLNTEQARHQAPVRSGGRKRAA
jgi:hypothetical protein